MAFASIAHAGAGPGNPATTPARDISGANLLAVVVTATGTGITPVDGVNTFVPLTARTEAGGLTTQWWYCAAPVTSTTYQVSSSSSSVSAWIVLHAWQGADASPFDVEAGTLDHIAVTTIQPGSVTPSLAGSLALTAVIFAPTSVSNPAQTIDLGFVVQEDVQSGFLSGVWTAAAVLASTAAVNPLWTCAGMMASADATIVVFRPAAGGGGGSSPVALMAHRVDSLGVNGGTSGALNTTGATLLVLAVGYNGPAAIAPTLILDSRGNTWVAGPQRPSDNGEGTIAMFFADTPTVGTGHTFTVNKNGIYAALAIAAFSGAAAPSFDGSQAFGSTGPVTSMQPGSLTPSAYGDLLVTALATYNTGGTLAVTSPFVLLDQIDGVGGTSYSVALAYEVQTTATARNPTWSGFNYRGACALDAHLAAATGTTGHPWWLYRQLGTA